MHAVQDFIYAGVSIKAGQVIEPGIFEADDAELLVRGGFITIDESAAPAVKKSKKSPATVGTKGEQA
jgi:hypothetical protein